MHRYEKNSTSNPQNLQNNLITPLQKAHKPTVNNEQEYMTDLLVALFHTIAQFGRFGIGKNLNYRIIVPINLLVRLYTNFKY